MRKQQIQAEWRRALKSLRAAQTLQAQGLLEDAISRAYYAVMHAAKAALLAHDTVAESHAAVHRLFGRELVRAGAVEKEWAEILARGQDQRLIAEYNVDLEADSGVAAGLVRDARRFLDRMAASLASAGIALEGGDRNG